jgi:hypothetical protein
MELELRSRDSLYEIVLSLLQMNPEGIEKAGVLICSIHLAISYKIL